MQAPCRMGSKNKPAKKKMPACPVAKDGVPFKHNQPAVTSPSNNKKKTTLKKKTVNQCFGSLFQKKILNSNF